MVSQAQGKLIPHAAHRVYFFFGATHRGQGHAHALPAGRRRAGAKGHLQLVVLGQRTHGRRGGALERLERTVGLRH